MNLSKKKGRFKLNNEPILSVYRRERSRPRRPPIRAALALHHCFVSLQKKPYWLIDLRPSKLAFFCQTEFVI